MKKQTDTRFFIIILILRKAVKFSSLNFPNDDHAQVLFFFSLGDISASFPNLHFGAAIAAVVWYYISSTPQTISTYSAVFSNPFQVMHLACLQHDNIPHWLLEHGLGSVQPIVYLLCFLLLFYAVPEGWNPHGSSLWWALHRHTQCATAITRCSIQE